MAKRQHILRVFVTVDIRKPANEGKKKLLTSGDAALRSHRLELLFFNEQVAKPGNRNSKNYKTVRGISL